jgi:hypothetical protein
VRQPHPLDANAILAALREHGSARAARSAGLRISVRRVDGLVFIGHVDHVVTDDQIHAFNKVIAGAVSAALDGEPPVTYEQALHEARRDRLRLAHGDTRPVS